MHAHYVCLRSLGSTLLSRFQPFSNIYAATNTTCKCRISTITSCDSIGGRCRQYYYVYFTTYTMYTTTESKVEWNAKLTYVLLYCLRTFKGHIISLSSIMFLDPRNIGLETCYLQLSSILAELWRTIDFSLMAALFCIQVCVRHI